VSDAPSDDPDDAENGPEAGRPYAVGYGRPPLHTRFQPGQSGNRRGRPKDARSLTAELLAVLSEQVVVREGERSRKVSKRRALIAALVNRALKGDHRAAAAVLATLLRIEGTHAPAEEPAALAAEDTRILKRAMARALADIPLPRDPPEDEET
jgi:hypothetical protein